MANKYKEGKCSLCGNFCKLSFEHVPPKSAFNDKPIYIQTSENLIEKENRLYGKRSLSHKGFGRYTLCEKCNNNTGAFYGREFAQFVQIGADILKRNSINNIIRGTYKIYPLNVLKQILTMFLSADANSVLQLNDQLVEFILNKESQILTENFHVFLYSSKSIHKRLCGYSVTYDPALGIQKWAEVSFPPFGYLLADDSLLAQKDMQDITFFKTFKLGRGS